MENRIPKYKIGDKVRVINYGHLIWENKNVEQPMLNFAVIQEDETFRYLDIMPERVGKVGIIEQVKNTQNIPSYSIASIGAWLNESQLELITK